MNNVLYMVVGASGSGKDYIVNKICKQFNMTKVISRTDRPMKDRDKDVNTHVFVSKEQSEKEYPKSLGKTIYNNSKYYVLKEDIEGKDFYIIDPRGVRTFDYPRINKKVKILFIDSPWYIRALNMFKRRDKIKDIINRLLLDRKEFKGFYKADMVFKNSSELYMYFTDYILYR